MEALAALLLVVSSGDYDRLDTPVSVAISRDVLGAPGLPKYLHALEAGRLILVEQGVKDAAPIPVQWDDEGMPKNYGGRLFFILPGATPKGTKRTFALAIRDDAPPAGPLRTSVVKGKYLEVADGQTPILRYNSGLMKQFPDKESKFDRSCYFHPLWAPSGEIITGDFHPDHAHHRGLWFAWVKATCQGREANFWEIQEGRGKIVNVAVRTPSGPVFADLWAGNHWMGGTQVFVTEILLARVYALPGKLRVFDLTSRQEASNGLELGKMHYGGLGFRGRDEWNEKGAVLDVLTSEGKTRKDANATKARWIDYTGRLGAEGWGGILAIEHPSNPRFPNGVRVHPSMAFFSSTLVQPDAYTIKQGEPLVLRYRIVLHDGKPDAALAERLAADFASPPQATWRKE